MDMFEHQFEKQKGREVPLATNPSPAPSKERGIQGVRLMIDREETCTVCGYVSHLGAVAQHHLIPKSVTKEAGMPESVTMSLCCNCHYELHTWCRMKVTNMAYDPDTKRFRDKSWDEKVRDYESAFARFKKYKDEQRKIRQGK